MADDPGTGEQATIGVEIAADPSDISNEALLAELEAEQTKAGGDKPAKAKSAPESTDPDDDEEGEDLELDDEESDDEADQADEDEDADEEDGEDKPADEKDPETAKRMAAVARTERRNRERFERERSAFDAERQTFARERTEWESKRTDGQKRFESLAARARFDPAGVLESLGLTVDDMQYAGEQAYARSKAAAADPKYRAAADRAMRDREADEKSSRAEERVAKLEQTIAERDKQAEADRVLDTLFGRVFRKADDSTPRVKAMIAKNPARARAELEITAFELAKKTGALPKSKAVLAAHEKKIARQLRDYGVEPDSAGDEKPADKTGTPPSKKPDAKPTPAGKGKDAKGKIAAKPAAEERSPNGEVRIPSREELLEELRSGAHLS